MAFAAADPSAIPIYPLVHRRLRLGPFAAGRDLVKFLGFALVGATAAAVTSAVVWLPFLAIGALVAFARVEGRTLDDYLLGYCRFRWRSSVRRPGIARQDLRGARPDAPRRTPSPTIRAGGIPIAYLPPRELRRLFEEWRSILTALDRPLGWRVRGEVFSPLPFLPSLRNPVPEERPALESYREFVQLLLRNRYRRVVDLTFWNDPNDEGPAAITLQAQSADLLEGLERLGIPVQQFPTDRVRGGSSAGRPP